MADKTQWSKPRGDVTSVEQFAGREWARHALFVRTLCLSVPASTTDPQALAFANPNISALDFSFHLHFFDAFEKSHLPLLPPRPHAVFDSGNYSKIHRCLSHVRLTALLHSSRSRTAASGSHPLDIWEDFPSHLRLSTHEAYEHWGTVGSTEPSLTMSLNLDGHHVMRRVDSRGRMRMTLKAEALTLIRQSLCGKT